MIKTLAVGSDPREELKRRVRFLREVEIPMLQAVQGEPDHLGTIALRDYSQREIQDATRLLSRLSSPLRDVPSSESVQLNDAVALRGKADGTTEEFVVHAPELVIRAPGYVSADTALGAAVLGRRVGDRVRVTTPDGFRTYVVEGIRRSVPSPN
ncbi:MAG: GreA/GreB family elongation factor [Actinomycetota bacterium]|nr:GreA/GreB family elongation factor [Actinomycetota bacterium]